jgi:hypothetical protein
LLKDGRIKRRRQKDIKFDAARKLSQCAINGVSCGEWDVREMSPTPSVQKELKYTRVQRFSYASHGFCKESTSLSIILKQSGMKACSFFKGPWYTVLYERHNSTCVWGEVDSFARSNTNLPLQIFPWVKPVIACAFKRFKTMDAWDHLIGYPVIWIDLHIVLVVMKSMCFSKHTNCEVWALVHGYNTRGATALDMGCQN